MHGTLHLHKAMQELRNKPSEGELPTKLSRKQAGGMTKLNQEDLNCHKPAESSQSLLVAEVMDFDACHDVEPNAILLTC